MLLLIVCNILFVLLYDKLKGHPTEEEHAPLLHHSEKYVTSGGHTFDKSRDLDGSIKELRL